MLAQQMKSVHCIPPLGAIIPKQSAPVKRENGIVGVVQRKKNSVNQTLFVETTNCDTPKIHFLLDGARKKMYGICSSGKSPENQRAALPP